MMCAPFKKISYNADDKFKVEWFLSCLGVEIVDTFDEFLTAPTNMSEFFFETGFAKIGVDVLVESLEKVEESA